MFYILISLDNLEFLPTKGEKRKKKIGWKVVKGNLGMLFSKGSSVCRLLIV